MAPYQNYQAERFDDLRKLYHAAAKIYGEKTLFLQKNNTGLREIRYRDFGRDVDALATALYAHALDGKRILLIGENRWEWALAYLAVACSGTVVPLDPTLDAETLASLARFCDADAVIFSAHAKAKVDTLDADVLRIAFSDLPAWVEEGRLLLQAGDRSYLDALIDPNAMCALLFTSGTLATPKGVMLSHRNLCFNVCEMSKMVYIGDQDVFLSVLPLHHVYESTCGLLCPLSRGATVAYGGGLPQLSQDLPSVRPTVMLCVPLLIETFYQKIELNIRRQHMERKVAAAIKSSNAVGNAELRQRIKRGLFPHIHKSFGGRLRLLLSGGASTDPTAAQGLRDLGIAVLQGYGLTECSPLVALNRDTFYRNDSAGMATPNTLLDVYDPQDDGTGEIRCKGDQVMLGYFKDPLQTARVIRNGWFYTGDLGHIDPDGFLFLTGRKKNGIVTHDGRTVYPEELETLLLRNRFVKEAVVVGLMLPYKHHPRLVAVIFPDFDELERALGAKFTHAQLDLELKKAISDVNSTVSPYKRIRDFLVRHEEFPKNTSHKIRRQGIAEEALEEYLEKMKK